MHDICRTFSKIITFTFYIDWTQVGWSNLSWSAPSHPLPEKRETAFTTSRHATLLPAASLASLPLQPMHSHGSSWQCAAGRLSSVVLSYVARVLVHKDNGWGRTCFSLWGRTCFSWSYLFLLVSPEVVLLLGEVYLFLLMEVPRERIVEFLWLSALVVLCLFVCRYIHFSHDRLCWCSRWFLSTVYGKRLFCSGGLH